jgi:hypothetical protein
MKELDQLAGIVDQTHIEPTATLDPTQRAT